MAAPWGATHRNNNQALGNRVAKSALGHKPTCASQNGMSALPPKADIRRCNYGFPRWAKSGHRETHLCNRRTAVANALALRTFSTSGNLRDLSKSAFSEIDEIFEYLKSIKLVVAQTAALRPDEATKLSTLI